MKTNIIQMPGQERHGRFLCLFCGQRRRVVKQVPIPAHIMPRNARRPHFTLCEYCVQNILDCEELTVRQFGLR